MMGKSGERLAGRRWPATASNREVPRFIANASEPAWWTAAKIVAISTTPQMTVKNGPTPAVNAAMSAALAVSGMTQIHAGMWRS